MNILPYKGILPRLEEGVYVAPGAFVVGDVVIGERSSIWFNTVVRGDENYVRIGSEANVQDGCMLHVTAGQFPLEIGSRVTVGHRAIVHGCTIEDDCLIGMGAIILDGARIGRGSLIAAGSVITPGSVVPPGSLVMGVPGVVKRTVEEAERRMMQASVEHYLHLASDYSNPDPTCDSKKIKGFLG